METRTVGKTRVVITDHGELHAFVTPEVMYNLEACQEVIRSVVGIYHPRCCSGLNILMKLAVSETGSGSSKT